MAGPDDDAARPTPEATPTSTPKSAAAAGPEDVTSDDVPPPQLIGEPTETTGDQARLVVFDPRSVWRAGLVVVAVVAVAAFGSFVLHDGGSVIFTLIMSWLASVAMEPAVSALAKHMKRGLATGIVMVGTVLAFVLFFAAFGNLLIDQIASFVEGLPALVNETINWINTTFDTSLDPATLLDRIGLTPDRLAELSAQIAANLLGLAWNLVGGFFSTFTFGLFVFYFSADAARLRRWVARLLRPSRQEVFVTVWSLAVKKTGGYVAARIVLAGICGGLTALWLLIIGMDYWLALGIWTGVVAQFVPTIGTYIAIALPVIVGLTSAEPIDGVLALAFALVYQQIENLTIEPKISADAVDVHPAVGFASVLFGAALFGVAGALVAVPVVALILAMVEIYSRRYEVVAAVDKLPASEGGGGLRLPRRRAATK